MSLIKNYALPFIDNSSLELFRAFCGSSLGPQGTLKSITNSCGHSIVASTSIKILTSTEFKDPCILALVESIIKFVRHFHFGGLTFGVLLTDLLLNRKTILDFNYQKFIFPTLEKTKIPFDIGNINHLQSFIRSNLKSKKWLLTNKEAEKLSLSVIEAFLKSIPDNETYDQSLTPIDVKCKEGKYFSTVLDGHLIPISHLDVSKVLECEGVRILLLNIQLEDNITKISQLGHLNAKDLSYTTFGKPCDYVIRLAEECRKIGIHLIANQKIMSDKNIEYIQNHSSALVLDRLGTRGINSLSKISNAEICTSIHINEKSVGTLSGIKVESIDGELYLRCWSNKQPHITLLVGQMLEDASNELGDVCRDTLFHLKLMSLKKSTFVLPGAGCTEAVIFATLISNESFREVANSFRRLAILIAGTTEVFMDKKHSHLWINTMKNCQCGLFSWSKSVELIPLQENNLFCKSVWGNPSTSHFPSIIDSFILKKKLIESAFERLDTFSSIESTVFL